jgi:uncharacterized protein (DUF2126 family)/transglutaminase-like putative cysteine protease
MSIRVALHHLTRYDYDRPVMLGPQVVRLRPAPHCRATILDYTLRVKPEKHFLNWQQDPQGNYLGRLVFEQLTRQFVVEVNLIVDLVASNPFDFFLEPDAEKVPFRYDPALASELEPFLRLHPQGPLFQALLPEVRSPAGTRTIDFIVDINQKVQQLIKYVVRLEPGVQTPEETLKLKSGSCRDSAWLLVQLLRHLGLAARFASGYLIQLVADEKPLEGPAGPTSDFTDLHAWAEVYLPGAGWVGLDPTSGLLASDGHIPLACTPEPSSAAPISGGVDKCEVEFAHEMSVSRVYETPRVTKPYTEAQWRRIDALGAEVDARLQRGDVRLTMGGEPTFVSVDDMESAQWNIAALGADKERIAAQLLERLTTHFAPGALRHFGQGKWYPGEQLPRWAYGCYFRHDKRALWQEPSLIGGGSGEAFGPKDAQRFGERLAEKLKVSPRHLLPAHEDLFYLMWRERRLPGNVTPEDSRLKDPLERARLAKQFEQGLDHVVGYALPIDPQWGDEGPRWRSGPLFTRAETLYLVPGDSPMGYRLPIDSLPWVKSSDYPFLSAFDPHLPGSGARDARGAESAERDALANLRQLARLGQVPAAELSRKPRPYESAPNVIRSVLCVEAREGRLHVFVPPVALFDCYEDLVHQIEATAAELNLPVRVEGYPPPSDPRLGHFSVTPDPGVIEVNIHPSRSWTELRERTTDLYAIARECRLSTEKFMLDGRHSGTGGGNHITLGGSTPPDSPLLRRPDLLRSLVGYWHDHPALSYLFSGLFIGPTSQAPRVDEARHDSVRELEVAFRQIPDPGGPQVAPWLVDRVFRHLLTDLTGNTHRSEFCIDKLYSPDSAAGRMGVLELRAFEMPPHARMSLAQQLLVRALVSAFWDRPYQSSLTRWGTSLHDRFMLPHFVAEDFHDVLDDLGERGLRFEDSWFAPHFEFRFPRVGEVVHDNVVLELRHALEPWHVLGEESASGATARYVDSSLERLQVKVRGAVEERHAVLCNGRRVPLHPTGTRGEAVAGVRFRAWQPPSCLHPTIGVHSPLTFEVIDRWNARSLGGCRYHVTHPGGRSYDAFPVNASEAEGRRRARFFPFGHTAGVMEVPAESRSREFPFTLDLRHP